MKHIKHISLIVGLLSIQTIKAIADSPVCAKAAVISGDTCSNVRVKFDLSQCEGETDRIVDKVYCVGQTITARIVSGDRRFEAKFTK